METIATIRRVNLCLLLDQLAEQLGGERGAAAELAARSGVKAPYISQLKNDKAHSGGKKRTIGDETARKLERGMEKATGWMDHPHESTQDMSEREFLRLYRLLTPVQRDHLRQSAKLFIGDPPSGDEPAPGVQPVQH